MSIKAHLFRQYQSALLLAAGLSTAHPALLWLFSEFGADYKYSDLLTYSSYATLSSINSWWFWKPEVNVCRTKHWNEHDTCTIQLTWTIWPESKCWEIGCYLTTAKCEAGIRCSPNYHSLNDRWHKWTSESDTGCTIKIRSLSFRLNSVQKFSF